MFTVYAIKSLNRKYIYVGLTSCLRRRLSEHNKGNNKTTKAYRPFVVIHIELYGTRGEARKREKYLKTGSGKEFLKRIHY